MAARSTPSPPRAALPRCRILLPLLAGLLLALPRDVAAAAPDCGGGGSNQSRYKALVCWLYKAKFTLPDERFQEGIFAVDVDGMACTDFRVASLKSSSVPARAYATTRTTPSIRADLEGMSAKCTGRYAAGGLASGNVVASVSTSGPLHLEVDVSSRTLKDGTGDGAGGGGAALPFPSKAVLSSCEPHFKVHDVQFSGSISAKIIGLFSGQISKRVTSAINENLCSLIKKNGEGLVNNGLDAARDYVAGLIFDGQGANDSVSRRNVDVMGGSEHHLFEETEKQPARRLKKWKLAQKNNVVTWDRDMPLFKRILAGVNAFVSQHMNEGVILKTLQRLSTWQSTMTTEDCEDCGFFFKGFNGLTNSLTKGTGEIEFPLPDKVLNFHHNRTFHLEKYGYVTLTARNVKISGINKFSKLELFRPEGKNRISSSIASDSGFGVTLLVDLAVRPENGAAFQGGTLNETFELSLNASNLDFASSSAWYLDREMFRKLSVGSFIHGSYTVFDSNRNPLNCIVEMLSSVEISVLNARMNLDGLRVSPSVPAYEKGDELSLEEDLDGLANNVLQLALKEYPKTVTEVVAGVVRTPVRTTLNDGFASLIDDTKKMPLHCVNLDVPKNKTERPFRLDSNRALTLFGGVVNTEGAVKAANAFIGCAVDVAEAKKLLSGHYYNFSLGELSVVLHDLKLNNVDSICELDLLKPEIDHYHVTNGLEYADCPAAGTDPKFRRKTSISFGMNLLHSGKSLGNINVVVGVKGLKLRGGAKVRFDMNYLPFVQISDLTAYPQCLSVPLTDFEYYGLNATLDSLDVNVGVSLNGQEYASPGGGNAGGPRSFTYKTEDPAELARVVSVLSSEGAALLEDALGDASLMQLARASTVCKTPANPRRSLTTKKRYTGLAGLWTLLIVLLFLAGNSWLFLRGYKKDEVVTGDADGPAPPDEQQDSSLREPLLNNQDDDGMDENLEVETPRRKFPFASSSSLMYHPSVHPAVKWGFPAVLILAFVLFLSSNLTVGATVDLLVKKANGENLTSLINIYEFSLGSTMREMIRAGVYLLMLLILFCSGIWPYIKLILMMISWIASTRRLSLVKRERVLYLLDSLGKFSLIDAYVLVLMMVAFRYNLKVEGVGSLDVYVTPMYGFYSFLFATIISLVSGHAMLFFHRMTMFPKIAVYSGRYESLNKHIFDDKRGRGLVKLRKRFRRTIVLMVFLTFVLLSVGACLKSFHFTFKGVAGAALGDDKARSFSLVSIGEHIPRSVQDSSKFGIHWIQTCYFFFALVMPLVCLVALSVLFVVPMRMGTQQRVFVIAEIANAWSAIEVFVIAIIASLAEISPFSESMVGEHCALLNQILSGWSGGNGEDLHYCFDVKSSIGGSSAVLIIGVALNSLLVSSLHKLAHHAIWERIEREDRPDATDDENRTVRDCVMAHTFVSRLRKRPRLGLFMFEEVSFGPHGEYEMEFENVTEDEELEAATSNNFWSEWRKIVSMI